MNAAAPAHRKMRPILSEAPVDFAEIYDENVELVSVATTVSDRVRPAVDTLLAHPGLQAQWIQGGCDLKPPVGEGRRQDIGAALTQLRDDIEVPVEMLRELLGCESCGVRIKVLKGPMCPRFHVDRVPCRMLMTYDGPGTEWIGADDVDWSAVAAGDPQPCRQGGSIQQFTNGSWSLLKGGTWDGDFPGVIHRSPQSERRRLLVTLDPIFSD